MAAVDKRKAKQNGAHFIPVDVLEWRARQPVTFLCALCGYGFTDRLDKGKARMQAHRARKHAIRAR